MSGWSLAPSWSHEATGVGQHRPPGPSASQLIVRDVERVVAQVCDDRGQRSQDTAQPRGTPSRQRIPSCSSLDTRGDGALCGTPGWGAAVTHTRGPLRFPFALFGG